MRGRTSVGLSLRKLLRRVLPLPMVEIIDDLRYNGLPQPFRTVRPYTLLSNLNLFFLQELARRVDDFGVRGDFVECGVYKGGSAGVLGYEAMMSRFSRRLWLYDAFAGMPEAGEHDDDYSKSLQGKFVGSEVQTRRIMERLKIPPDRYKVIVGWFENTLPVAEKPPIALLHVDCDFYDSVKLVLKTFYPYVEPGGYVVLNDYGSFQGCRLATNHFIANHNIEVPLMQIDQDAYYFQKPQVATS